MNLSNSFLLVFLTITALLLTLTSEARVYRCEDSEGNVTFSDKGCAQKGGEYEISHDSGVGSATSSDFPYEDFESRQGSAQPRENVNRTDSYAETQIRQARNREIACKNARRAKEAYTDRRRRSHSGTTRDARRYNKAIAEYCK